MPAGVATSQRSTLGGMSRPQAHKSPSAFPRSFATVRFHALRASTRSGPLTFSIACRRTASPSLRSASCSMATGGASWKGSNLDGRSNTRRCSLSPHPEHFSVCVLNPGTAMAWSSTTRTNRILLPHAMQRIGLPTQILPNRSCQQILANWPS
jgi:hypothetical protein